MSVHPLVATLAVTAFATACFALVVITRHALARREADFRMAELSLEHLVTATPVVMFRTNLSFQRTYVSPNAAPFLGYDPDKVLDWKWRDLVHPDDIERVFAQAREVTADHPASFTCRFRHGDGSWRWLQASLRLQETGDEAFVVGCAFDVSDRIELEASLREAKEVADRANSAKSDFLSRMSHELRTPLTSILGFSELLELDGVTDDQREYVDHIGRAGHHLLGLINEVLDISRIESGRLGMSVEPVSVVDALDEAVDLMAPMAAARGVELLFESPVPDVKVLADGQRLKQVLLNLLSNAIKYNRRDGAVWLNCTVDRDVARVSVRDTGPGISEELRPRLFHAFDRLGAEQSGEDGSGLGLVLSKRLVGAMGGELDLDRDTAAGEGSRFWFELPLAETVSVPRPCSEDGIRAVHRPRDGRVATVLQVEDTRSNVDLVARIMRHRPELHLVSTAQGERALELAAAHQPAVILLDLHLPDLPGIEVLARLRADARTAGVPVVIVTADASDGQQERLLAAGAQTFLTKPVSVARLLEVVDASVQTSGAEARSTAVGGAVGA